MDEKRRFARTPFDGSAILELQGEPPVRVELKDLSLKGALIYLPDALQKTQSRAGKLTLELEDTDIRIALDINVMHISDNLMGMEFTRTNVDGMQHLRRMLELNLGEEDPGMDHLVDK